MGDRRPCGCGTNHLVVNLQILENQLEGALLWLVDGVEEGEAVGAAEEQGAIVQQARGAIIELIAAQSVLGVVVGKLPHGAVIFTQAVHGADP